VTDGDFQRAFDDVALPVTSFTRGKKFLRTFAVLTLCGLAWMPIGSSGIVYADPNNLFEKPAPGTADPNDLFEQPTAPSPAQQEARQATRQAARQSRDQADAELYEQMERVSRWMDQYATWNQKFPDPGDETNYARQEMNLLVPNNPYSGDKLQLMAGLDATPEYADPSNSPGSSDTPPGMQGATLQESTSAQSVNENDDSGSIDTDTSANLNRIWLTTDPSLNENMAQEYLTRPPEDWSGQPGSINIVSNNQNLIVIWGAGANGKPIKFPGSNKTRLIIGRYKLLYGQSSY